MYVRMSDCDIYFIQRHVSVIVIWFEGIKLELFHNGIDNIHLNKINKQPNNIKSRSINLSLLLISKSSTLKFPFYIHLPHAFPYRLFSVEMAKHKTGCWLDHFSVLYIYTSYQRWASGVLNNTLRLIRTSSRYIARGDQKSKNVHTAVSSRSLSNMRRLLGMIIISVY